MSDDEGLWSEHLGASPEPGSYLVSWQYGPLQDVWMTVLSPKAGYGPGLFLNSLEAFGAHHTRATRVPLHPEHEEE